MKKKVLKWPVLLMILVLCMCPIVVYAAEARAHFGSAYYEQEEGDVFNIGVYITAADWIGSYSMEVAYDPAIVEYISGGASEEGGVITLAGMADGTEAKNMLSFRGKAKGVSPLFLANVSALDADGNEFTIQYQDPTSITIKEKVVLERLMGIRINGEEIDVFDEKTTDYELVVAAGTESLQVEGLGADAVISDTTLTEEENVITLTINNDTNPTVYTLHVLVEQSEEVEELPADESTEDIVPEGAETDDWSDEDTLEDAEGTVDVVEELASAPSARGYILSILKQKVVWIPLVCLVVVVFAISGLISYVEYRQDKAQEERRILAQKKREAKKAEKLDIEFVDLVDLGIDYVNYEEPVITVEDLCMDFKIATQNVSGIKEWLIEKVKGKISYRLLHALDHISFEVYPGEVVGIIGTNGSGKSTLLKIVSGALRPTSGRVIVDRSKVQLLTLGTGFDMELTARENVYLNGAIIGYSREFIDEHYEDIVAFAELEDFMEEKVKNFSSGMVSRLGFAIATAGDAAEILILDEVLSVGDEFFRKKSLKRVQEMIHGGSTVLMVSHSMDTIMKNCNKVVWIEKGQMKMVGDAKEVCGEYKKLGIV